MTSLQIIIIFILGLLFGGAIGVSLLALLIATKDDKRG